MTWPEITFRIAFGSSPLSEPPLWTDLSDRLLSFTLNRGRTSILEDSQTGQATFVLDNDDDALHPANVVSPFYTGGFQLEISKRIQLRVTWQGTDYDLFTGFIDAWRPSYPQTTVVAFDAFGVIARDQNRTISIGSNQRSDQAIATALNVTNWSTTLRDLSQGQSLIQAATYTDQQPLQFIQQVSRTEIGNTFVDGAGQVVFQDRHLRFSSSTPVASFTNDTTPGGPFVPYTTATEVYDGELVYNRIEVSRQGGSTEVAEDAGNFGAHFRRVLTRQGVLLTTDSETQDQANYLLARFTGTRRSEDAVRIQDMTLGGEVVPDEAMTQILTRQIGDRIQVRRWFFTENFFYSNDYFIEGIQMQAARGADSLTWTATFTLDRADSYIGAVLDDPTRNKLDDPATRLIY